MTNLRKKFNRHESALAGITAVILFLSLFSPSMSLLTPFEVNGQETQSPDKSAVKAPAPEEDIKAEVEEMPAGNRPDPIEDIRGDINALRKAQADAGADMTTLNDQIRKLRGELEEISKYLESLKAERQAAEATWNDLATRMAVVENALSIKEKKFSEETKRAEGKRLETAQNLIDERSAEREVYEEAFEAFKSGRYDESRAKFQKFLKQYPATPLSNGAQFWIGECYYQEKDYEKAILEYDRVIKQYPEGDKVPHALLKQGLAFYNLGDVDGMELLFKRLINDYPESHQAEIARAKLKAIQ